MVHSPTSVQGIQASEVAVTGMARAEKFEKPKVVSESTRKHFWKTELCRFFPRCNKGDQCPFAHTPTEVHERPDLTKTTLCTSWRRGRCPLDSAECKFAHGPWELRSPTTPSLRARRRRIARPEPGWPGSPLKELTDAQDWDSSTRMSSGTPSGPPSECGSVTPGGMSRQVSTMSDMPDLFDGISRQVSANALVPVPLYPELVSNRMNTAGATPKSCRMQQYPELAPMVRQVGRQPKGNVGTHQVVAIQMPVLIEVPYVQMQPMPMMASLANMNMTPEAMSETKMQIEQALLAAMPASYED